MDEPFIAIVDDDTGTLKSISRLLKGRGYRAETFESAEAFLSFGPRTCVECLVVDIQLKDMSGIELVRHLVATGHRFPVIFATGSSDQTFESQARALDCIAFLHKPFEPEDLLTGIERALVRGR
jgi:FixJ family two-component response regulator